MSRLASPAGATQLLNTGEDLFTFILSFKNKEQILFQGMLYARKYGRSPVKMKAYKMHLGGCGAAELLQLLLWHLFQSAQLL